MDLVSYIKMPISRTELGDSSYEKLIVSQSKNYEPEGSLLCSQEPA